MKVGLYLHFPYCKSRCTYCDFNAYAVGESLDEAYIEALVEDIRKTGRERRFLISTVFLGGGTPSLYAPEQIERVLTACRQAFDYRPREVTMEANPGTVTLQSLTGYRAAGIDRLSFGVQTFESGLLNSLNRIHDAGEAEQGLLWARQAGFENVSLDLMYGLPGQSMASWRETVERAVELGPDHLSLYQLTVEPGTHLEAQLRTKQVRLPPEERTDRMDRWMRRRLRGAGFRRYEISNWARPGRESRHNLVYWNDRPYLGLGCGATGFVDGWRVRRILHPQIYARALAQGRSPVASAERMGQDGSLKDCLMMGLRIRGGVPWARIRRRFPNAEGALRNFFAGLPEDWIRVEPDRVRLTSRGADFATSIQHELMDVLISVRGGSNLEE